MVLSSNRLTLQLWFPLDAWFVRSIRYTHAKLTHSPGVVLSKPMILSTSWVRSSLSGHSGLLVRSWTLIHSSRLESLVLGGSFLLLGPLALDDSFLTYGALACGDSFGSFGALADADSFDSCGALANSDSFEFLGALAYSDSFGFFGALTAGDSFWLSGPLRGCDSFNCFGALFAHDSFEGVVLSSWMNYTGIGGAM